ncbi:MAG: hypothetical protein LBH43_08865 [Treponema sp.]|jgi:hypothetical protein|nr:hypothetical protein [Treponema sp.]
MINQDKKMALEVIRLFIKHKTVPLSQKNIPVWIIEKIEKIWKKQNHYGYCDGFNYQTCMSIYSDGTNHYCPYVQYGIHCGKDI